MLFGGLCEVEDEVVRVGSKLRVRWRVVSGFSGGMEKEGKEIRGGFVLGVLTELTKGWTGL